MRRYTGVREAAPPTIYVPASQMLEGTAAFYVRAAADPASLGPAIRAAVREADPMLPVIDLHTQDEQVERLTSQERLFARLSGCFGAIALVLACVGLYGLMSYLVLRRTGEIGLRMALGAVPGQILRMILGEAFVLAAAGAGDRTRGRPRREPLHRLDALRTFAGRSADLRRGCHSF